MAWVVFQRPQRGGPCGTYPSGEHARHVKLTDRAVAELRSDRASGMLLRELCSKYGIGMSHASRLVRKTVRS